MPLPLHANFLDHRDALLSKLRRQIRSGWQGQTIGVESGPWRLGLDSYQTNTEVQGSGYTRLVAPLVNPEGFQFTIYEMGPFSWLGKLLGMQDIRLGDPAFDNAWIIQSNSPPKIRDLLEDPELRRRISATGECEFTLHDDRGAYDRPGETTHYDEVLFSCAGLVTDPMALDALLELFALALTRLSHFSSAYGAPRSSS